MSTKPLMLALKKADIPVIIVHAKDSIKPVNVRRFLDKSSKISFMTNDLPTPLSPFEAKSRLEKTAASTVKVSVNDIESMIVIAKSVDGNLIYRAPVDVAKHLAKAPKDSEMFCLASAEKVTIKVNEKALAAAMSEDDEDMGDEDAGDVEFDDGEVNMDDSSTESEDDTVMEDMNEEDSTDIEEVEIDDTISDEDGTDTDSDDMVIDMEEEAVATDNSADVAMEEEVVTDNSIPVGANSTEDGVKPLPKENRLDINDTSLASELNIMDQVKASEIKSIDLICTATADDPKYYLIMNDKPVAKLVEASANSTVKQLFKQPARLIHAFNIAASVNGVTDSIMNDFGIKPMVIKITASDIIEQEIKKRTQPVIEANIKDKENMVNKLNQSLSIAAAALNKGFYKDKTHALKHGLIKELASIGVHQAEALVDKVFKNHGEDYLRTLIQTAREVNEKSDDSRNEISKLVAEASYQPTAPVNDEFIKSLTVGNIAQLDLQRDKPITASTPNSKDGVNALRAKLRLGTKF